VCENIGVKEYASKIHTRIEVTDNAFLFHKYTLFTVPFALINKIYIYISSFIDPHLLIDIDDRKSVQFTLRVNLEKTAEEVPFDLFLTMKALGDETRLKILRCIYKKINSTQAIAMDLGMTEAGVSKHLKLMYQSGILHKKREGNFIHYIIEREIIDRIPMDIYQYLDS
jgi:DNA-binding transcriptional ArsR family regulator